ncbi:hypothetical protein [Aquibaculum arenosum]|uniref:Thermonuclease family protein n=1 Tax=Aquibaculum arenosum TaxID=3032591 RepID=A0ABT5YKW7_9PROT|nr:hypothetical protein [Fodinicurvata sp. CAU 1616]MDF2095558.1 hypothetical protein [Fodinicurvata sp. CAU 1616]
MTGAPEAAAPNWQEAETAQVAAVLSATELRLEDGRTLRLAGVRGPKPPLAYDDHSPWRQAEAARAWLERLAPPGSALSFLAVAPGSDRHRRLLVQGAAEGAWLQERLLREGALLLDLRGAESPAPALAAAERLARDEQRGLWADPAHQPLHHSEARRALGRFALIEGRVLAAEDVRGTGYLNFEVDWRQDFTIRLPSTVMRRLTHQGQLLSSFEGRRVRVRGWVFFSGGAMIELASPQEIELLERAPLP